MRANSPKQRCPALRYVLLECFALLVMESLIWPPTRQQEVVMTSRSVGQEGHCLIVIVTHRVFHDRFYRLTLLKKDSDSYFVQLMVIFHAK